MGVLEKIKKLFVSDKPQKPAWEKRTLYVYKPGEDAIVWRVEQRDNISYIYRGWSKTLAWRMEGDKLFSAETDRLSYIIIGNKICDASGEKVFYRIADGGVYRVGEAEACLIIRNSIIVQGTL